MRSPKRQAPKMTFVQLAKPVKMHKRFENCLGYQSLVCHGFFLCGNGHISGGLFEHDYGFWTLLGEDYFEFDWAYSVKKFNVKREEARLKKNHAELEKKIKKSKPTTKGKLK